MTNESNFLHKGPCPECGSRDNLGIYTDHEYCFGCQYTKKYDSDEATTPTGGTRKMNADLLGDLESFDKTIRGITPETFDKWRYKHGLMGGSRVHVATHFADNIAVGQKIRFPNKDFKVLGKMEPLYGMWLWAKGGKKLIITEGELDALSVSQSQGNKWPVVSIPNGAQGAVKAIQKAINYVESFDQVVFCFDMDIPGQKAAKECAALLPPGKAFIASMQEKDANKMLEMGLVAELISSIWQAAEFRPDGILSLKDVIAEVLRPVSWGRAWPYEQLTNATYGRRDGETYFLGAGTGVGKTDLLTEWIAFDLRELKINVGVLMLEQAPTDTVRRIAGKIGDRRFHVPDGSWTEEELNDALAKIGEYGQLYMYDNFGATEWDSVKERITYMATAMRCKHIYLDHITALAAAEDDERVALERITAEMAMLAKRLQISLHVVSHLATPERGAHEEGAHVSIRQFKGSRAIGFWAHFMFGLERDQQCEDPAERNISTFRILKDRYTGQSTGTTFRLIYNHPTGRLLEYNEEAPLSHEENPFDDI